MVLSVNHSVLSLTQMSELGSCSFVFFDLRWNLSRLVCRVSEPASLESRCYDRSFCRTRPSSSIRYTGVLMSSLRCLLALLFHA